MNKASTTRRELDRGEDLDHAERRMASLPSRPLTSIAS
jgi:hypothetical protein